MSAAAFWGTFCAGGLTGAATAVAVVHHTRQATTNTAAAQLRALHRLWVRRTR